MTTLVTGASGLLGRTVASTLIERGEPVRVLQRTPSGLDADEVLGHITDAAALRAACADATAVVHLAAKVTPTGSWAEFEAVNVGGTAGLLAAARTAGVGRFVHVSTPSVAHRGSSIVGGDAEPADPTTARGHYARSKAQAEVAALAADDDAMAVIAVRPHLVWGPDDTQLVGRIVDRAGAGRLALVNGGAALVDSTYVTNAADAIVAALDRCRVLGGEAFVVSNGEPRPVRELIERICAAAGVPGPTRRVPLAVASRLGALAELVWDRRSLDGEPPITRFAAEQLATAHWFDQRRTRARLEWEPRVSLAEGFDRLAASFRLTERP